MMDAEEAFEDFIVGEADELIEVDGIRAIEDFDRTALSAADGGGFDFEFSDFRGRDGIVNDEEALFFEKARGIRAEIGAGEIAGLVDGGTVRNRGGDGGGHIFGSRYECSTG